MGRRYFVQILTNPDVDPSKCNVGTACATQAVTGGHFVNGFFASHAVKLLQAADVQSLDEKVSQAPGQCLSILQILIDEAEGINGSTASQAVTGVDPLVWYRSTARPMWSPPIKTENSPATLMFPQFC
jgi:hypothetical protein